MKTYDFIQKNIGNKVFLINGMDLGIDRTFREFIYNKTEFTLIRLSKKGMAIIEHDNKQYSVPPSNVRAV